MVSDILKLKKMYLGFYADTKKRCTFGFDVEKCVNETSENQVFMFNMPMRISSIKRHATEKQKINKKI